MLRLETLEKGLRWSLSGHFFFFLFTSTSSLVSGVASLFSPGSCNGNSLGEETHFNEEPAKLVPVLPQKHSDSNSPLDVGVHELQGFVLSEPMHVEVGDKRT